MKQTKFNFLLLLVLLFLTGSAFGQSSSSAYDWSLYKAMVAIDNDDGKCYAVVKSMNNGKLLVKRVIVLNNMVFCPESYRKSVAWDVDVASTGKTAEIHFSSDNYLAYKGSGTDFELSSDYYTWQLDGVGIKAKNAERYIMFNYNGGDLRFGVYMGSTYPAAAFYEFAGDDDGYLRSGLENGKVGTICLSRAVDIASTAGAKFYSVVGKRVGDDGLPASLVLGEESSSLVAGRPYLFVASDSILAAVYSDSEVAADAGSYHGLHGVLQGTFCVDGSSSGSVYAVTGNAVKRAGAGSTVGCNRAYIDMDEVPVVDSSMDVKGLIDFPLDGEHTDIKPSAYDHQPASIVPVTSHIYIKSGRKYLKR